MDTRSADPAFRASTPCSSHHDDPGVDEKGELAPEGRKRSAVPRESPWAPPRRSRSGMEGGGSARTSWQEPERASRRRNLEAALVASLYRVDVASGDLLRACLQGRAGPRFSYSRSAAPLIGLRCALRFTLRELRGIPQGGEVEVQIESIFDLARRQLASLAELGYVSPVMTPRTEVRGFSGH